MGSGWASGLFALAGVLVASALQLMRERQRDTVMRRTQKREERLAAYSHVTAAFEEARIAAAKSSLAQGNTEERVARYAAAISALALAENASFRAWLVANKEIRDLLDSMTADLRDEVHRIMEPRQSGVERREAKWPDVRKLREPMRRHLAEPEP